MPLPLHPSKSSPPSSHNDGFSISIWPIIQLNIVALLLLSSFCVLFVMVNGGMNELKQGLSELEVIIISYFGGIGFLTLIAASWLAWLSGPTVFIEPSGIQIESTWLMDQSFPERHQFKMSWDDMGQVSHARFLTMRYLKIQSKSGHPPLYVPLFIHHKDYLKQLKETPPSGHPLPVFLNEF